MSSIRFPQSPNSSSPISLDPIINPFPAIPVKKEERKEQNAKETEEESTDTITTASNTSKTDSDSATTLTTSEDAESMLVEVDSRDRALNVTGDDLDIQPSPEPSLDKTPPTWKLRPNNTTTTTATTNTSSSGPKIVRGFTIPPPAQSPPPHRTIFNPHPDFVPWLTATTAAIAAGTPSSTPPSPTSSGPQITRGFKVPPESRALAVLQFLTRPEHVEASKVAQLDVSQTAPALNQRVQESDAPIRSAKPQIPYPSPAYIDPAAYRQRSGESLRESQDRAIGTPPIPIPGRNSNPSSNITRHQESRQRVYPQRIIRSPEPQLNTSLNSSEPHFNRDEAIRRIYRNHRPSRPESEWNFYRCETRSLLDSEEGQRELEANLALSRLEHPRERAWERWWRSVTARFDAWRGRLSEWVRRRDGRSKRYVGSRIPGPRDIRD